MGVKETLRGIPDVRFTENENAARFTSFGVGGAAKYFIMPRSIHSLIAGVRAAAECGVKYRIIGNGSNLLVSDGGYDGLIVCTKNLNRVLFDKGEIAVLCGTPLSRLTAFAAGCGRTGFEGLRGIPATLGGAVYQNAGAFGQSVSDHITDITSAKDGEIVRRVRSECRFGYRDSIYKTNGEIIISAKFRFPKRKSGENADYSALRRARQPAGRTCGSVFLNPTGDFAGALIERAGLKGHKVGGARVSDKHANFIIAEDGATALDVYELIEEIKTRVYEKFGVLLKEEVEYLGEF